MTVPVTGSTDTYGIEYLVPGEPLFHTRAKLQRNAETIEAALLAGGITPPGASDLAALVGRVNVLEERHRSYPLAANTAAGTTEFEVTRLTNLTVTAGARYRITPSVALVGSVVGDRHYLQLRAGLGLAGAIIGSRNFINAAATQAYSVDPHYLWTAPAGATVASFTLTLQRFGTGTVRTEVTTPGPAQVEVERVA